MPAFDEPDVCVVGAAADTFGRQDLEKLRVKGALVKQQG
jgi:hypothetical protein